MPTRNSWPTRWARVIWEKTRAGQESGFVAGGDGAAWLGAGRTERLLAEVPGGPAAGWPAEVSPHPEQASTDDSTQAAAWRLIMRLGFLP